jgi:2-keto-4-pentenoate hydratase
MEAEFGFEMAEDVPPGSHDAQSIRRYVKSAFACLEIVNHHHHDWTRLGAPLLVADNAIHGAWVTGAPTDAWRDIDLAKQAVTLYADGRVVQTGSGAAVLGNPLNALAWLASELPRQGRQLKAGDRVSSGVATDVHFAQPVERVEADFGPIGRVAIDFA